MLPLAPSLSLAQGWYAVHGRRLGLLWSWAGTEGAESRAGAGQGMPAEADRQVPTGHPAVRGVLRGPAALEAVPPHVLLGADVVLHLQGPVEDGLLLRRPAQQGELLVQGGLTPCAGGTGEPGQPTLAMSPQSKGQTPN